MKVERAFLLHQLKASRSSAQQREQTFSKRGTRGNAAKDNTLLKPYENKMEQEMK